MQGETSLSAAEAPSNPHRLHQLAQPGPHDMGTRRGAHRAAEPLLVRLREAGADRLPATLRGGLLRPSPRAVLALALLGTIAVAVGVWYAWQARPVQQPAPAATVIEQGAQVRGGLGDGRLDEPDADAVATTTTPDPDPTSAAPETGSAAPTEVVVHVVGRVLHPGVVHLPVGSRVADAVAAVGGLTAGADAARVNLARPLADGEQVLVLAEGEPAPAPAPGSSPAGGPSAVPTTASAGAVNLNTATLADLDTLPGVGPVLAQRILDWRQANGAFSSVDELREVTGVGEKRLADLRDKVTL